MDATLAFIPDEHQIRYSAMTGQSLYYMGTDNLAHKILAIAEEEGVTQASYALKLLQSDGTLRIASRRTQQRHRATGNRNLRSQRSRHDVPHNNQRNARSRITKPLPHPARQRIARPDRRHSPTATSRLHAQRADKDRKQSEHHKTTSKRAAFTGNDSGCHPVGQQAEVPH